MAIISRDALYDLVWNEPVRMIAQRMGVSDVWLKKCCAKAGIPVPDRGYWAKLRADKTVVRQKLPPRPPGTPADVTIGTDPLPHRWPPDPEAELAAPPPIEPSFVESIEAVTARVDRSLGKVRFVRDLGSAHRLIRHALDEDALRRLKPSDAPLRLRYSDPFFETPFEQRRLKILNSLFLALTSAGHQPWLNGLQARNVGVTIGSQKVSFGLDHPRIRTEANGRIQTPREAYEILRLDISASGDSWTDDDGGGRIEDRLREIILKLIVIGEVQYRADARRTYENARRRRTEMERMIADRRTEAVRLAHEKAAKADAKRRTALLRMAADHRAALDIRTFVMTALETLGSSMAKEGPAADWAAWAFGVADQIDPVGRLHIAEDGTAAQASAEAAALHRCPDTPSPCCCST